MLRPFGERHRYDLALDLGDRILRVQCKWARLRGQVFTANCQTSRHTPHGYVRTTYSRDEVDAIAVYVPDTDRCYLIPIAEAEGCATLRLRVGPTGNNQAVGVRWARDYELTTSIRRYWTASQPSERRGARR